MGFTARQLEMVEILKSGVAFLESQPKKEKYILRDILAAAGDDFSPNAIYALIKQLNKKKAKIELTELKSIFDRLGVHVGPLDEAIERLEAERAAPVIKIDPGAPEGDWTVEEEVLILDTEPMKVEVQSEKRTLPEPSPAPSAPTFESEIESLSAVLRTLAPLTRTMRMSVLAAAESFYGIGH
jgi:hypothetical protein